MPDKKVVDMNPGELKKMCLRQSKKHGSCGKCPAYYRPPSGEKGYCELAIEPYAWKLKRLQRTYHA